MYEKQAPKEEPFFKILICWGPQGKTLASLRDHFLLPPSPSCRKAAVSPETNPRRRQSEADKFSELFPVPCAVSVISALLRYGIREAEVGNVALPSCRETFPRRQQPCWWEGAPQSH